MKLQLLRVNIDGRDYAFKTSDQMKRSLNCAVHEDFIKKISNAALTFESVCAKIEKSKLVKLVGH